MRAVDTRIDPELLVLHLNHLYDIHYKQDLTWTFQEYYRGLRWSVPSTEETQTFGGNSWPSPHSLEFIVLYLKEKIVFKYVYNNIKLGNEIILRILLQWCNTRTGWYSKTRYLVLTQGNQTFHFLYPEYFIDLEYSLDRKILNACITFHSSYLDV